MVQLRANVVLERLDSNRFSALRRDTGERFEMKAQERYLLQLVSEMPGISEVRAAYAERFSPLDIRDVLEFVELLRRLQLVEDCASSDEPARWVTEKSRHDDVLVPSAKLSTGPPVPLTSADRGGWLNSSFDALAVLGGWIASPGTLAGVLTLALIGGNVLVRQWDTLFSHSLALWRGWHPVSLAWVIYLRLLLLLSLPSALLTGMVCRQYGGRVKQFEMFLWEDILPMFRVDMGDSLTFMTAAGRRRVILVTTLYPLALASISLTAWQFCRSESARTFWLLLAPPALLACVLRWNIFSETGGYFLLCDFCEDWNLEDRARDETRAWLFLQRAPAPLTRRERFWLRTYGIGQYVYRGFREALLLIGLAYVLMSWLRGGGALLYVFVIVWRYRRNLRPWL